MALKASDYLQHASTVKHSYDSDKLQGKSKEQIAPIGSVVCWLKDTPPDGFLECNGAQISRTTYSDLFAIIGTQFGPGDGTTTFALPDFRGEFLRGWDHGKGTDPNRLTRTNRGDGTTGDQVGTKQLDEFKSHTHSYNNVVYNDSNFIESGDVHDNGLVSTQTGTTGGSETRPRNINVMYCIRF